MFEQTIKLFIRLKIQSQFFFPSISSSVCDRPVVHATSRHCIYLCNITIKCFFLSIFLIFQRIFLQQHFRTFTNSFIRRQTYHLDCRWCFMVCSVSINYTTAVPDMRNTASTYCDTFCLFDTSGDYENMANTTSTLERCYLALHAEPSRVACLKPTVDRWNWSKIKATFNLTENELKKRARPCEYIAP